MEIRTLYTKTQQPDSANFSDDVFLICRKRFYEQACLGPSHEERVEGFLPRCEADIFMSEIFP